MKSMKTHHPHLLYQVFLTQSFISKLYMEPCLMHIVDNPLLTSVSTKLSLYNYNVLYCNQWLALAILDHV